VGKQVGKWGWKMTRKRKTVYILGTGFSASAGLPTMANFIEKAKNTGVEYPILKKIQKFHTISSKCNSNLSNIEEALSILTADDLINNSGNAKLMVHFIKDVIKFYTPEKDLKINDKFYSNDWDWENYIIGDKYKKIFHFLSRIMLLKFKREEKEQKYIKIEKMNWKEQNDIITFNYDTLLENCIEILNSRVLPNNKISLKLYKLHGSVDSNYIVPPTLVKNNVNKKLVDIWNKSSKIISAADRIVFIGYSLPKSDAYFRYFLKLALNKAKRLEEIKVVCKDETGEIEENYKEFSKPVKFKFINKKWENIVPTFDNRNFSKSPNNTPEKRPRWIQENNSERIFGWGTDTCKEQYEKGIFID